MGKSEQLILPMPPSANRYWRHVGGRVYVSKEARSYRELVGWEGAKAGLEVLTGDVSVSVIVRRQHKRGDIDNYLKVLFDAMQGVMIVNDKQIKRVDVEIIEGAEEGEVLVEIEEITEV